MRTINSPGVQITEIDLSSYSQPQVGTNVFVAGFADQGPVDQVLQIGTITELEDVFGTPKTPAEAYFYESCKQTLQSPGNLYATRLPYGPLLGEGFANQHSALLFPATTGVEVTYNSVSTIQVQSINIVGDEGIESVDFSAGINIETLVKTKGGFKVPGEASTFTLENTKCVKLNGVDTQVLSISTVSVTWEATEGMPTVVIGRPRQISLDLEQYQNLLNGEYEWAETLGSNLNDPADDGAEPVYNLTEEDGPLMESVGLIVINTAKSTNNEKGVGYYVSIADNSNFGPQSDYDSVGGVIALTANQTPLLSYEDGEVVTEFGQVEIPTTRFLAPLSATYDDKKASISRVIETVPKFNFGDDYFADSLVVNVHRVFVPNAQPNMLGIHVMESFIGSLDKDKKTVADAGGVQRSFFVEDSVNRTSSRIKVVVNPHLSKHIQWVDPLADNSNPQWQVRVHPTAKYLFADGVYEPSTPSLDAKNVGNVAGKLEHALRLVDNPDNVTLDIITDSGLSTIHTNKDGDGQFDDLKRLDPSLTALDNPDNIAITSWLEVYNVINSFVSDVRKDCFAIVDPLRQIFLRGNSKTAERRGTSFTEAIYTPLKNLLTTCDSNYTAVYGNWVLGSSVGLDRKMWLPASGAVAAMYAKSDAATQPWFAPAGFTRGSLTGVLDLAINPNQKQRDNLYTISVNPIVNFPGEGIVVFGQKTLQLKPTAFDRINVRRLFLALERATVKGLKYFVFEPNTAITRTRLLNTVTPIFLEAKRTQGVYDYMVVCDERNNTPDSIDRNELVVDIYIKPVKAAEFILVNFIATRTGQDFSELI